MLSAMRAFTRRNQPVLCSPFVLGGANTPSSAAPAVAQLNAVALSALAYTQVIRKGVPAVYGHYLGQTVTQIAMACGFQTTSHFSKVFRAHIGRSPLSQRAKMD